MAEESCRLDGARLFVPENAVEATTIVDWLKQDGHWDTSVIKQVIIFF